jgi:hypothetical protein
MNKSIVFTQGEYEHYSNSNLWINLEIFICVILAIITSCLLLYGCGGDTEFGEYSQCGTYQGRAFKFTPDDSNYSGFIRYPVPGSGTLSSTEYSASKYQKTFWHILPDIGPLLPITWQGFGSVQFYDNGKFVGAIDHISPAMWPEEVTSESQN